MSNYQWQKTQKGWLIMYGQRESWGESIPQFLFSWFRALSFCASEVPVPGGWVVPQFRAFTMAGSGFTKGGAYRLQRWGRQPIIWPNDRLELFLWQCTVVFPSGTVHGLEVMLVILYSGSEGWGVALQVFALHDSVCASGSSCEWRIDPGPNRSLYKSNASKEYEPWMLHWACNVSQRYRRGWTPKRVCDVL